VRILHIHKAVVPEDLKKWEIKFGTPLKRVNMWMGGSGVLENTSGV